MHTPHAPNWTRSLSCTSWFSIPDSRLCRGNSVGEVWEELCGGTVLRTIASSCFSTKGIPHYPLTNCPLSHPQQQPGIGEGACTPVSRWSRHTYTIASSTPNTRADSPLPSQQLPSPCPRPQQQPGSPLQSVPTSPTACSSACAPSSSLSR